MTVTTVDPIITDVMFMAELNRLLTFQPLTGVPRRPIQLHCGPQRGDHDKYRAIDRDFR
jgi:hypothetical protein